jgi:hypothetical protein
MCPGLGAAINAYLPLIGVGAFTSYGEFRATTKQQIAVGQEFFVDYGIQWFSQRPHLGPVPLYQDFNQSTVLTNRYFALSRATKLQVLGYNNQSQFSDHVGDAELTSNRTVMDDLWNDFIVNTPFKSSRLLSSIRLGDREELMRPDARNLTSSDLRGSSNTSQYVDGAEIWTITDVRRRETTRSVEWLRQHGICGDHLAPGPSSVSPQAGRGAFATRTLPAGIVVAPMPLVHIANRSTLVMYPVVNVTSADADGSITGWHFQVNRTLPKASDQLIINYCFGHRMSTLLLCPYGPMTGYINHAPTHSDDPTVRTANVKIQWAHPDRGNHMPSFLNQSIEELESSNKTKLAFELVSVREILKGEEVLLDYGEEWSLAWERHVSQWSPPENAVNYISAYELNHPTGVQALLPLKTVFEQIEDPYPGNIEHVFSMHFFREAWWREAHRTGTLKDWELSEQLWNVDILRRELDKEFNETVYYLYSWDYRQVIGPVPRQAIHFRNKPYTSDMLQHFVFRHDMRIPDEMFPLSWRNL